MKVGMLMLVREILEVEAEDWGGRVGSQLQPQARLRHLAINLPTWRRCQHQLWSVNEVIAITHTVHSAHI